MTVDELIEELKIVSKDGRGSDSVLIESGFTPAGKNHISSVETLPTKPITVVLCRP